MELSKANDEQIAIRSEAQEFLKLSGHGNLLPNEEEMFLKVCQLHGLNPFKREIYLSAYGEGSGRQFSVVTGYEVYIKRAEASGRLDGWKVETSGTGDGISATVTIHRKDWNRPFTHTVEVLEYIQRTKDGRPNRFWATKPVTMLKKVAISQGFRLCFPEILSGMPYTKDEMGEEVEEGIAVVMETTPTVDHAGMLRECTTLEELASTYKAMPADAKKALVALKDEMKAKLAAGAETSTTK